MLFIDLKNHKIPALGFGTWQLRGAACETAVRIALETGYRHIDTAQIYENEEAVGAAIKASRVPREDIFLTTKIWMSHVHDGALQASAEDSLRKLQTDYVDLLLIHWPVKEVPFAEQMKALDSLRQDGRARLIGVSNFTVAQMTDVTEHLGAPIATNQVEYHPFLSQAAVLEFLRAHDMFLTAYSPLARGKIQNEEALVTIAHKHGKTVGQVALRWLLQQDRVAAIPKAAQEKHIRQNFDVFNFTLDDDDMNKIHALGHAGGRLVNPEWAPHWDKPKAA